MMAKASTGTGKEPAGDDGRYDPEAADRPAIDPAEELPAKRQQMAELKVREKSLQEQIARLTAHVAAASTLSAQFGDAQVAELTAARQELTKFVTSGMKALEPELKSAIEKIRGAVDDDIKSAGEAHEAAREQLKQKQASLLKRQEDVAAAITAYTAAKEAMARAKRIATEFATFRANVEALVKTNDFRAAGFWLVELHERLDEKQSQLASKDEALAALSAAERGVEHAHEEAAKAESSVMKAKAEEAEKKKAADDAVAKRVPKILEKVATFKATAA